MTALRRRRVVPAAVGLFLLVLLGATCVPFLRARTNAPQRADAVILLSGDHGERQTLALRLLEEAVAPTLVLVGTSDGGVEKDLCSAPKSFEVVCVRLNPDSTRNEARATAELAEQRGWRSLVVVTSTPHATRAHMLFSRCFDGSVATLGAWPPYGRAEVGRQVVREWFATAKALMSGRC